MKIASKLTLGLVLQIFQVAPVNAGSVHLGILNDSERRCDRTISIEHPTSDTRCAGVKFDACSSCNSVALANNSDAPIEVDIVVSGVGFSEAHSAGAFYGSILCERPDGSTESHVWGPDASNNCGHLLPGKHCSQALEFCPEQSRTSHGQVKVTIRGSGEPKTTRFGLVGIANYTPELQAADEARRRHVTELMKIPHVVKVELDPTDDEVFINVEVDSGKSLDQVRRAAPPKVEGYDVEVTTYIETGYAL